ncbi:MAG: RNA polymerase sigma factor [Defluviitaleaceae bacterium]|nr:RNA polymerase sigma factor [Defluviitaleaceae bacterium]
MEDHEILDLYFNRKEEAITETRNKYGLRLYKVCINILRAHEDAEEIVSDTLLKAWGVIPPNRPEKFGAYLAKIARNLSINKWQARGAARRGGGEINLLLSELEDCIPAQGGPEVEYESARVQEAINAGLATLDKSARAAFVLRYFHGESIKDVCERFDMSESKVKSILFRARKKLGAYLEKEGVAL